MGHLGLSISWCQKEFNGLGNTSANWNRKWFLEASRDLKVIHFNKVYPEGLVRLKKYI